MTDRKTRVISNLLSLVLGAVIGVGCYRIAEQVTERHNSVIKMETPLNESGAILTVAENKGIKLATAELPSSEYDEYGISAQAESAYTLTATITPSYASNKAVDWSVAFANASSTWASGKTVTDYVTVTPTSDGALTAIVENIKDFGEQILVKVTSRDNPSAEATCTVDYAKRVTGVTVNYFNNSPLGVDVSIGPDDTTLVFDRELYEKTSNHMLSCNITSYSAYTVDDSFGISKYVLFTETLVNSQNATMMESAREANTRYFINSFYGGASFLAGVMLTQQDTNSTSQLTGTALESFERTLARCGTEIVAYLEIECTGTYSTYTKRISVSYASEVFAVTNVELDETNMIV